MVRWRCSTRIAAGGAPGSERKAAMVSNLLVVLAATQMRRQSSTPARYTDRAAGTAQGFLLRVPEDLWKELERPRM
jgi:hypothetical protein